jgi:hypothetical protein
MFSQFKAFKSHIFNIPGWHTKRKIVILESDDWGSIRIPSRQIYYYLLQKGYALDKFPYSKDCLESNKDVTALLEVLIKYKDRIGHHPIFTINNLMANPDFARIKNSHFASYFYEEFIKTYSHYPDHDKSFKLLKEGIEIGVIKPQLHGREHLNCKRWLQFLKSDSYEIKEFFDQFITGLPSSISQEKHRDFQRAFDYDRIEDRNESWQIIDDACRLFQDIWGFKSNSFVAPNFFWDDHIEKSLIYNGVKYIKGQRAQFLTDFNGNYNAKYHFTGQVNKFGQIYLVRNCYFEPTFNRKIDWVVSCLNQIASAFLWGKPAIISSHRVNYIGGIEEENRDRGLYELSKLLAAIIKKWPEVEFMSSDQLGNIISALE